MHIEIDATILMDQLDTITTMSGSAERSSTVEKQYERNVIAVVKDLVHELHPQRARFIAVSSSSRIERDLGIDSLGRTELILRLERAFHLLLPAQTVGAAETVADLINALMQAHPDAAAKPMVGHTVAPQPLVGAALTSATLVDALEWHAVAHADRPHLTVLENYDTAIGSLTFGELKKRAQDVARGLVASEVAPGDRVALMLPTSADFFIAFFAALYAGAIPVPIYPPMRLSQLEDHLNRQVGILSNAGVTVLITLPEWLSLASIVRTRIETLRSVASVAELGVAAEPIDLPRSIDPNATALIQYTSGSTGEPKGVMLSHANLLANIRAMGTVMEASSADIFVSWLPLYHDMGLIGAWLGCLHYAAPLYVMSPLSFLIRPENWLWAIHRYRATFSASPNFGFELCLNKIADADLAGLDLSSLRMVANGAEPVSALTVRRFMQRFRSYGFAARAMAPVYGLAESSVGLAFPPLGREPIIDRVDRDQLSLHGDATPAKPNDAHALEFVACGQPLPGHEIRILDAAGYELGERREGRLEFRGPSTTCGYFRNEAKTRALFRGDWLDSGDRAYMADGDIYIVGRVKDIIIRAGRHLYPHDIEEAVAGVPGIRKGGVAVFGVMDRESGTERIVVMAETRERGEAACAALKSRVHEVVTDVAGTPPDDIVLAPPRSVPKTSSGKIRRGAAQQMYESHQIGAPRHALWWQIFRLIISGLWPRLRRALRTAWEIAYAGWWWFTLATGIVLGALATLVLPRMSARWAAIRWIGRAILRTMGVRVTVEGLDRIPRGGAILAFNHASYVDALAIVSILPGEPAIAAKRELADQVLAGALLSRLGIPFVERYDVSGSLADAEALVVLARQGRTIVFFPEGTFTRRAGLSQFYLGAFKIAAEANLSVLPCVIHGTRAMLRGEQWFPRHAAIRIEIGAPIAPMGKDFASVLKLRDTVRGIMLARCGEPELAEIVKPPATHP
jgi:1-acyl-sn-glycerol-3-phosphate acyltransferase